MHNKTNIIKQWISGLMNNNIHHDIIDSAFIIEDGMTLKQYIEYEQDQFSSLSSIYDLDLNFNIKLLDSYQIEQNKEVIFFYLLNSMDKIVCKMNLTILEANSETFISSNNFQSQLVPKYSLNYNQNLEQYNIAHIALAIKSPYHVENIVSPHFQLSSLSQGDNFFNDLFYHAKFLVDGNVEFNSFNTFYLSLSQEDIHLNEKRKIFFDMIDDKKIPFILTNQHLVIVDEHYPVHLSYWKNGINYNHEYPRKISIDLQDVESITITDCLDNDWNITL